MKSVVIVEGHDDHVLVERVLKHSKSLPPDTTLFVAGGQSSAESLGRSLVATRRLPVALILDADTNNPDLVREKRDFLEASLRSVSTSVPWIVILMVPEIEAVFFRDPQIIRAALPGASNLLREGQLAPKETLNTFLRTHGLSYQEFIRRRLSRDALSKLANLEEFRQLRGFIEDPYHQMADASSLHRR